MLRKFDQIFKEEGTDNVVWVMDYSWEIRNELELAVDIWPQDVEIGWLFFNLFQFVKIAHTSGKGDCLGGFDKVYKGFEERIAKVPAWGEIPWGLGAWGIVTNERTPVEDQEICLRGIKENLESGRYPRMKASIYFNSLTSRVDETQLDHMQDTFADYLASPAFYDQDRYSELKFGSNLNPDEACDNQCPGSCYWSW